MTPVNEKKIAIRCGWPRTCNWNLLRIALAGFCLLLAAPAFGQSLTDEVPGVCSADSKVVRVLLLGTYHFANPGKDQFNLKADDVLVPKRQKEIEELVKRLNEFKPTKVAVEAVYEDKATIESFEKYLKGESELTRNETEQLGFRLAKLAGNSNIYPIDVHLGLDDSKLGPLIGKSPELQAKMGELDRFGKAVIAQIADWLEKGTIGETLYQMNRPEAIAQAQSPYLGVLAPIADGDNYAGADMVADWYKRNLRILANLNRIAEPGDRIVIVYGQGHIPILRDFVIESPDFCSVDPLPYLGPFEKRKD